MLRSLYISVFLVAFFFLIVPGISVSQDFSNKGKDFWITFPAHVDGNGAVMGIYITSDQSATGQVQLGGTSIPFSIAANTVRRIFLGQNPGSDAPNTAVYQDQLDGVKNSSAIHVTATQPVVVYAHIIRQARSGSSLILPTPTWGREYVIPSYRSSGASGANSGRGVITVVAKETNTLVEIVPTANSFNGARPTGTPYTITLNNPGDVYQIQFQKDADISGTIVRSIATAGVGCKPIGVFSATTWSAFNCTNSSGGDNLYQQLFPSRAFGRTFLTAPFKNRQVDIIRVFTIQPGTVISKTENGNTVNLVIGANGFAEFETASPTRITANNPISVVQYMNSQTCDNRNPANCANGGNCPFPADPEMVILNPIEQTINNITVFSAHRNYVPAGQSNVNQCFLNIIIPTPAAASFRINGAPPAGNFTPIAGTGYSYLQEDVSTLSVANPVQQLNADSSFSCIAYGYGNVESYGYNAGTNVRDLFQFITIRNPSSSVDVPATCQATPFNYFITLPYPATNLKWLFFGNFPDVTINTPVPDSTYMREGKTLYRYPLPNIYNYNNAGNFKVSVIATNPTSDGCEGEQQIDYEVVVYPKPVAGFNLQHSGCLADSVRFTNTGTILAPDSLTRWQWNFGDNTTGSGRNISHRYTAEGNYNVKQWVTSSKGCVSDTALRTFTINANPKASFTMSGPTCQNQPVTFTSTSIAGTGTLNRYQWDLGNGTTRDVNNGNPFTVVYTDRRQYTVKLVVTSSTGCLSDTSIQSFNVTGVPEASFDLPEVCLNDAFAEFKNTSTMVDGTLAQTTWRWKFGDPNANPANADTSILLDGRHKYTAAAIYPVTLVATSNTGCKDTATSSLTVNGDKPLAAFDLVTTGNLCSNLPVQIRNRSTVNFGTITRLIVYWNWGVNNTDSTMDNSPLLDRVYQKQYIPFQTPVSRTVQIRLQAFSGTICVNDVIRTVTLHASPDVKFATIPGICLDANPRTLSQGFDAGNIPGNFVYSGPGVNAGGLFTPSQTGAGNFNLKYKYVTNAGCTDSANQSITVWPRPVANFDITSPTCINSPVEITDRSIANANALATWNYDLDDGTNVTRTNNSPFTKTYANLQNYSIQLQVITDSGCTSAPVAKSITIHPLPVVAFDLPVVCMPQGRAAFTNRSTVAGTGGTPLTYVWQFGPPGATSTDVNPVYFYPAANPYNVRLTSTSARGCVDTATRILTEIYPQALAAWEAMPPEVCIGAQMQFNDRSNPLNRTITNWFWNFDNGTTATGQNQSRLYTAARTYNVSMYYTTDVGCNSDTLVKPITVHPYPLVNAGPDRILLQGGEVLLIATASGSSNYVYQWTPATWLSDPAALQPLSRAEADITYTLTVTGAGGCQASDNVFVRMLLAPEIPSAFSPNGDGINDVWAIRHLDSYPGATVQVFDRYGRAIFRSTGYNRPWDGNSQSKPVPVGVYYYIIDPKNGKSPMTGSVTIIR